MKIQSKFMTGLVSRIVKKVLRTKLGCEVDIQLNEFRTTVIDDKLWVTIERRKQHGKQQGGSERERA